MKLAIQENLLPGTTAIERFQLACELGFKGVEVWGRGIGERIRELEEASSTTGIPISTICSGYRGDLLGAERRDRELAISDLKQLLSIAAELGAVGVIVVPTFRGPKLPDLWPLYSVEEIERRILVEELRDVGAYADDVGAYVLLEPLNRYETHFMHRLEQAVAICEEVGCEYVKVMADFFHMNIEEADIPASLRLAAPHLKHIHLADSNRLPPGFGHTDFQRAFRVLREVDYEGFMALECRVPEPRIESLRKSVEYLRRMVEE